MAFMKRFGRIRDRVTAKSTIGLALAYLAILAADAAVADARGHAWTFELAVGALLGALALLRRGHSARTAALGLAACAAAGIVADAAHLPSQPGLAATIAIVVLGVTCLRRAAALPAAAVALAGLPVMVVGRLAVQPDAFPLIFIGVVCWLGAVGLGLWLRYLDARRREAVAAAQREERLQLARELHDVVAHYVTGIVVQAQAAQLVAERRPEALPSALTAIEAAGGDALAAMRRTIGVLRDGDDAGGRSPSPERLDDLVARFAALHPTIEARLTASGDEASWPPETAATVQRIVQEALTNVARHAAGARTVCVNVEEQAGCVTVEVSDDAPAGPAPPSPDGYGLVGMRERVGALGGTLASGPHAGGGWRVQATLPLPGEGTP